MPQSITQHDIRPIIRTKGMNQSATVRNTHVVRLEEVAELAFYRSVTTPHKNNARLLEHLNCLASSVYNMPDGHDSV